MSDSCDKLALFGQRETTAAEFLEGMAEDNDEEVGLTLNCVVVDL